MKQLISALLTAVFLTACIPQQIPSVINLPLPGVTVLKHPFHWPVQGAPSEELKRIEAQFKTIEDIAKFLDINYPWVDDYDISTFLSPNQLVERKKGVCTAFARFWQYELNKKGIKANFIAVYSTKSAHAVVVFEDPVTGDFRLCSNQYLYVKSYGNAKKGGSLTSAYRAAALEFYSDWFLIEIYGEDGKIRETITNSAIPANRIPASGEVKFDIKT